nr:8518_t:CDS:2 [Entrophospora candida]
MDYSLSQTYPQDFILPSKILKNHELKKKQGLDSFFYKLANFRNRFPVVCWKKGHHVLMRSAQPMVGIFSSRGLEDEILIQEILGTVSEEEREIAEAKKGRLDFEVGSTSHGKLTRNLADFDEKCQIKMCILDARNYTSALSNIYNGGGYENTDFYPQNTTLEWLNLPNIHAISNAHTKLLREIATNSSSPNWFSILESTGWLNCVAGLLKAAGGKNGVVSKIIDEDESVLVHCTDGWDRTPQLVSLAQIMLDPYYRTLKGFRVLIEKEWITFGHQFRARSELPTKLHYDYSTPSTSPASDINSTAPVPSPIFLLFLTCVHHLLEQFPASFEFNDFLLLCLARAAAGNSPFGDFLCNSELERETIRLRERTRSIWSWVHEHRRWFKNERYQKISSSSPSSKTNNNYNNCFRFDRAWKKEVLRPDTGARVVTLWSDYYFPKDDHSIALLSVPPGPEIMLPSEIKIPEKLLSICKSLILNSNKLNNKKINNKSSSSNFASENNGDKGSEDDYDNDKIYVEDMFLNSIIQDGASINNDTADISTSSLLDQSGYVDLKYFHSNKVSLKLLRKTIESCRETAIPISNNSMHFPSEGSLTPLTSNGITPNNSPDLSDFVIIES